MYLFYFFFLLLSLIAIQLSPYTHSLHLTLDINPLLVIVALLFITPATCLAPLKFTRGVWLYVVILTVAVAYLGATLMAYKLLFKLYGTFGFVILKAGSNVYWGTLLLYHALTVVFARKSLYGGLAKVI